MQNLVMQLSLWNVICKIYNVRCKNEIRTVVAVPFQSWAAGSGVIRGKLRPCCSFPCNYYQILRIILKDILRIFWEYFGAGVIREKLRPCCSFPSNYYQILRIILKDILRIFRGGCNSRKLIAIKYWELFWMIFWEYFENISGLV